MSLPVWGNLAKSQTDAEKIEEAIVRLITEHNEDETAHLGVGQSLQSHKAAEIIDHLAESIVEDKIADGEISSRCITNDQIVGKDFRTDIDVGEDVDGVIFGPAGIEMWNGGENKVVIPTSGDPKFRGNVFAEGLFFLKMFIYTAFESLDSWNKAVTGTIRNSLGALSLRTGNIANDECWILNELLTTSPIDFVSKNPNFQISCLTYLNTSQIWFFGIGQNELYGDAGGFGFKISNGNLYCYVAGEDHVTHTHQITGITVTNFHVYRAEMFSLDRIDFYVDNVLVYSWAYDVDDFPSSHTPVLFGINGKTIDAQYKQFIAQYLTVCQDL